MLEREREAVELLARQPGLVAGGLGVLGVLSIGVGVGTTVQSAVVVDFYYDDVAGLVAAGVVLALLLPLPMAGLYRVALDGLRAKDGGRPVAKWPFDRLATAAVGEYPRLLTAALVARLTVSALAVTLAVLALSASTAVDYARYAADGPGAPSADAEIRLAAGLLVAGSLLARLAVVFFDLPVLDGEYRPTDGPSTAVGVALASPRRLLRYALGRLLVFSPAVAVPAVGFVLQSRMSPPFGIEVALTVVWLAVSVAAAAVGSALVAAYHVVVYERDVAPLVTDGWAPVVVPGADRGLRVASVVALLVLASVAGAAAVRVGDVRPEGPDVAPVEADGEGAAIVTAADRQVATRDHRQVRVVRVVNGSTGERRRVERATRYVDRTDRQYLTVAVSSRENETVRSRGYRSERFHAMSIDTGDGWHPYYWGLARWSEWDSVSQAAVEKTDTWGVARFPVYPQTDRLAAVPRHRGRPGSMPVPDGAEPTVLNRSDERVVVGTRAPRSPDVEDGEATVAVRYRLVVDRDTGRPLRVVDSQVRAEFVDGERTRRWTRRTVVEYDRWDSVDVQRPEETGRTTLAGLLWDYVYY